MNINNDKPITMKQIDKLLKETKKTDNNGNELTGKKNIFKNPDDVNKCLICNSEKIIFIGESKNNNSWEYKCENCNEYFGVTKPDVVVLD
jgi:hypothetical protein